MSWAAIVLAYLVMFGSIGVAVWYRDTYRVPLWQYVGVFEVLPVMLICVALAFAADFAWKRLRSQKN